MDPVVANLRIDFVGSNDAAPALVELASATAQAVTHSGFQVVETKGDLPGLIVAIGKGAAGIAALVSSVGKALKEWLTSKTAADNSRRAVVDFTYTERSEGRQRTVKLSVSTESPEALTEQLMEFLRQQPT